MSVFSPLFAGIEELIPIIIFIIIAVLSVLGQILGKAEKPKRPPGGARPARRPPGQPVAGKPAADQLTDEIDDFLRQAARQAQKPRPKGARRAPAPVKAQVVRPVEAQVVHEAPLGAGIRQHVKERLEGGRLARQTAKLGSEVSHADKEVEQRLHQVFDHEVSHLSGRQGETARATQAEQPEDHLEELPVTAAAGLAAMFSDTRNIRQAIIINEVLTRPQHRWT